jgi:hypothetical protein
LPQYFDGCHDGKSQPPLGGVEPDIEIFVEQDFPFHGNIPPEGCWGIAHSILHPINGTGQPADPVERVERYLMTNLDGRAESLCQLYGCRMQVEALFRDQKNRRNGWALSGLGMSFPRAISIRRRLTIDRLGWPPRRRQ